MAAITERTGFISFEGDTVTLNGICSDAPQTRFYDDKTAVQLRKAGTKESGFNWSDERIKNVVMRGLLIFDDMDMACLNWFMERGIKIMASESKISPDAFSLLHELVKCGSKAVEGSSITIPSISGYSGSARTDLAKAACEGLGFTVHIS